MKSKIIVIEGTDCSGKETQSKLLEKKLLAAGKKCIRVEFPAYDSPTGKIIGGPYLGKKEISEGYFKEGATNVDPQIASLYYAADRKYNVNKILEMIDEDCYIILDRYTSSNMAHQGSKIIDKDERFNIYKWIDKLEYWLLKLPVPDNTIFLHMPLEYSLELRKNRVSIDQHESDLNHLQAAENAYIELSELYNWDVISCIKDNHIKTIEEISEEVFSKIIKD